PVLGAKGLGSHDRGQPQRGHVLHACSASASPEARRLDRQRCQHCGHPRPAEKRGVFVQQAWSHRIDGIRCRRVWKGRREDQCSASVRVTTIKKIIGE
ncbi:hypothetical protein T310_9204, partial [Rasamsonia emersonii CBS 393.64]